MIYCAWISLLQRKLFNNHILHPISGGASAPANLYCRCPAGAARLAVPSRRPKGLSIDLLAAPPLLAVLWGPPSEGYWLPHQGGVWSRGCGYWHSGVVLLGWCSCYCFMLLGWCSCYCGGVHVLMVGAW